MTIGNKPPNVVIEVKKIGRKRSCPVNDQRLLKVFPSPKTLIDQLNHQYQTDKPGWITAQ